MRQPETPPFRQFLEGPQSAARFFCEAHSKMALTHLVSGASHSGRLNELAERSVLLTTVDQLAAALR
jgi:hypothetical protein